MKFLVHEHFISQHYELLQTASSRLVDTFGYLPPIPCIDPKDWDVPTVDQLVQFLYMGDYSYLDPTPIAAVPSNTSPILGQLSLEDEAGEVDINRLLTPPVNYLRQNLPVPLLQQEYMNEAQKIE